MAKITDKLTLGWGFDHCFQPLKLAEVLFDNCK